MSKHTPGPWRVEDNTTLVWGACSPDDQTTYGMGYPVADARTRLGHASPMARSFREEEGLANAHLIAAAPELLDVLKAFVEQEVDYMTINNLGDPEQQHNVIWARKIIAKAEAA